MKDHRIGLDIGTSAVRAVEVVVATGRAPVLEAFGQVGLEPGAVVHGEVRDPARVSHALVSLWRKGGFAQRRVRLAIGGPRVLAWEMVLASRPPEALAQEVSEAAERMVPFASEGIQLGSAIVGTEEGGAGAGHLRLLVAAAHHEVVDAAVSALEGAGLEAETIEVSAAALVRTVARRPPRSELVVTAGADLTIVALHEGGALRSLRSLSAGGNAFGPAPGSTLPASYPQLVRAAIDDIEGVPGRGRAERVVLTGGASRTDGLVAALTVVAKRPVELGEPLAPLDTTALELSGAQSEVGNAVLGVALGLTRSVPADTRVDLLPAEVAGRQARGHRRARWRPLAVGLAALVVLGSLTAWRASELDSAEGHVRALRAAVHAVRATQLPREQMRVRDHDAASGVQRALSPLLDNSVNWIGVLNQLGAHMPAWATLRDATLRVSGAARPARSALPAPRGAAKATILGKGVAEVVVHTRAQVAQFERAMNGAKGLDHVEVSGPVTSTVTWVTFPITFGISAGSGSPRVGVAAG